MINITKNQAQDEALNMINKFDNLLLSWATGVGKSLAFIKIQEKINPNGITYIVVNETNHINNWKEEYIKHKKEHLLKNTKIFCYASLKKYVNSNIGLLCLDEAHHSITNLRIDYLKSIIAPKIIALTATLTENQKSDLDNIFGKSFKEYNINLNQALNNNIIAKPTIYLVPLELNYFKDTVFYEESRGIKAKRIVIEDDLDNKYKYSNKAHYPNVDFRFKTTEQQKYKLINDNIEFQKIRYQNSGGNIFFKNKWLNTCSLRKRYLGELKTPYIKKIIDLIGDAKFICSTTSIKQSEEIGDDTNTIHSKKNNILNEQIIDNFNKDIIKSIITVDKLQEGQNLYNIDAAIITQLDNSTRSFIQKTGRALRSDNPRIYVLYFKNTRDEEFLENVYSSINPEYIKTLNI